VAKAKGSMILFTDSDCIVMNDWVNVISAELLRSNKEDESVMAVCGKIVSNSGFVESAHAYAGYAYVQEGPRRSMKYLNTACAAVFKKAFLEVGGFSEDLRVTEDPELGDLGTQYLIISTRFF
jgi:GT2 family glycosyltransferase